MLNSKVVSKLSKNDIVSIENGLEIPDFGTVRAKISLLEVKDKDHFIWEVVLTEGKNREIRKVCDYYSWHIVKLIRIQYGPYKLLNLKQKNQKQKNYQL